MNTMYLSVLSKQWLPDDATFSDRFGLGILTTVLGMAIIFVLLAVLWAILELMKFVPAAKTAKSTPAPAEKAVQQAPAAAVVSKPAETQADDTELIAVITAAIAAHTGANPSSFRVVSFKRKK